MQAFRRTIIVSVLLFLVAGCDYLPLGYTPIREINRSPGSFEGQEIKVKGTVTDISKLPFVDSKTYSLRDETGEITVFTESTLPPMEDMIAIKATVNTTAIIGKQSFGLRLQETKKLPAFWFGE